MFTSVLEASIKESVAYSVIFDGENSMAYNAILHFEMKYIMMDPQLGPSGVSGVRLMTEQKNVIYNLDAKTALMSLFKQKMC